MNIIFANADDPVYFLKVKAGELLQETRKEKIWWPLVWKQNLHLRKLRFLGLHTGQKYYQNINII